MTASPLSVRIDLPDGQRFGPGKAALLRQVEAAGSIKAAAEALNMSYPRALKLLDQMNATFASPVLATRHGGSEGGGAELTETGRAVLALYDEICASAISASSETMARMSAYLAK